ncbi:UxaA family hydrolase [Salegentibacter maritimus]|uniref:UxaA family hydrolase n=1 Tax=Salegentibacter maritimus TaxID=2794347 RepID=UPI0018E4501F|nr:altronate dehydratase family protein [Salegentibacter maritimus]MBI6117575.1 altronate dehydratase [Salegentibacter maritimus]
MNKILKISEQDNVGVALCNLVSGEIIELSGAQIEVSQNIEIKHKIALQQFSPGDIIVMYGVPVGEVVLPIGRGDALTIENIKHRAADYKYEGTTYNYNSPDITSLKNKTFMGYHREDGQVGTANYWLFVPLVFCQNRNLKVLKEAFETELGYKQENPYKLQLRQMLSGDSDAVANAEVINEQVFKNVDGIKFLAHEGGCGGTRDDAQALVNLLAGYIKNPNVAGATVLSLGCQHAQMSLLEEALVKLNPQKPVLYFEQQQFSSEKDMLQEIVSKTYPELEKANSMERKSAGLDKLNIGLECGGSDGFSGITANPLIGYIADKITAVGGRAMLSEFPELCGVEQDLIDRCQNREMADKFINLMETYNTQAQKVGSGFDMNPSPGNIKDGLITDAIKSAGAATKAGRSPISGILDYTEYPVKSGLHLLCTPGNDVESTTGLAGSGANLILFSTGLGTPTGNPVCPVVKISSNSALPKKMKDIIDFDAGKLISEEADLENLSEDLLNLIIEIASGKTLTCAHKLGQDDFIPWKRGVSL